MSKNSLWFWKRNGKVTGPFAAGLIQQYIILRRVHPNDLMSQDKKSWRKASTIDELIPEVIKHKNDENYDERLRAAKRWADDRGNSRDNLVDEEFNQRQHTTHLEINTLGWKTTLLVIIILCFCVYAVFYFTPARQSQQINCQSKPVAKIELQGCHLSRKNFANLNMEHANLKNTLMNYVNLSNARLSYSQMQYSQLSHSDLSGAKLDHSNLTAAVLNNTILDGTDFSYANLSYANLQGAKVKNINLEGAKLSKTIWFNGKICAASSIGRCLINKKSP